MPDPVDTLTTASEFGAVVYLFTLILLIGSAGLTTYFLKVSLPESKDRRESQKRIAEATAKLAEMSREIQQQGEARDIAIEGLVTAYADPESKISTIQLRRAGIHACDVLESWADDAGLRAQVDASIKAIRRELEIGSR